MDRQNIFFACDYRDYLKGFYSINREKYPPVYSVNFKNNVSMYDLFAAAGTVPSNISPENVTFGDIFFDEDNGLYRECIKDFETLIVPDSSLNLNSINWNKPAMNRNK